MHKPTIVFFGNERLATGFTTDAPTLRALVEAGYHVAAVVSNFERSRSRNARKLEIEQVAQELGIPVLLPAKPADIIDELRSFDATVGVLVAYGKIVPESIIDVFPRGIVNIHPSLLPLHRGPTPIESVILNGETETGVSIMQLVKAMDAGPVYAQQRLTLRGDETKYELASTLLNIGKDMLIEHLPAIIDGSLQPTVQDDGAATYDDKLNPESSVLDFSKPAERLEREIRAYADWPKSRTRLANKDVIITAAHIETDADNNGKPGIIIETTTQRLVIDKLKPAGKAEMTAQAFMAGNKV